MAKLERYELLAPEFDSEELEVRLLNLEAVQGSHSAYSIKDLDAAAARVRQRRVKKR